MSACGGLLRNGQEAAQQRINLLDFVVFGTTTASGIVSVPGEVDVSSTKGGPRGQP